MCVQNGFATSRLLVCVRVCMCLVGTDALCTCLGSSLGPCDGSPKKSLLLPLARPDEGSTIELCFSPLRVLIILSLLNRWR